MAVSYLRSPTKSSRRSLARGTQPRVDAAKHGGRNRFLAGGALLAVVLAAGVAAIVLGSSGASLSADGSALARVNLPFGGGKITSVSVLTGPNSRPIAVTLRGNQIWPQKLIPAHQTVTIEAVVKRPGWISWLSGSTEHLHLVLITPSASLQEHYLTLKVASRSCSASSSRSR